MDVTLDDVHLAFSQGIPGKKNFLVKERLHVNKQSYNRNCRFLLHFLKES